MAHFKRTLTVSLQQLATDVRGVQSLSALVAALTTQYQIQHAKLHQMVRVLLNANPRTLGWIPLGADDYIAYKDAVHGIRFRVIPDRYAIDGEYVLREWLEPFVPDDVPIYLGDAVLPCSSHGPDILSLHGWYADHAFVHGDHIIVEVRWQQQCRIVLHVDRTASMRLADTVLIGSDIATRLRTRWQETQNLDAVYVRVLALYAQAAWRNAYPPLPWQALLNAHAPTPVIVSRLDLLRVRINELQQALRIRRIADHDQGLWDGIALRYSAVRMFIDTQYDDNASQRVFPVDTRLDHTHTIDDAIAQGVYDVQYASDDQDDDVVHDDHDDAFGDSDSYTAALDSDSDDFDDGDELDAALWGDGDIDSDTFVSLFANRHPALRQWSITLLKLFNESERRKMLRAESEDDHMAILTAVMQRVLPSVPELMNSLRHAPLTSGDATNGGMTYAAFEDAEFQASQIIDVPTPPMPMEINKAIDGDAVFVIELALRESQLHLREYEQWLATQHTSKSAIRQRGRAIHEWALFLAQYYTTSLADATYAMLDEYLFFHYPRHTSSGSTRMFATRIRYVRDYYAYRASVGDARVLPAAQAMYDCRNQAVDVLDVLLRIQQYPHELTPLVVHLFAPYTV